MLNDSVGVLADSVSEIKTSLADAGEVVNEYQLLVDEAQLKTANAIEKLPRWVRWTAIGLTVLLVWLIVIQAGLLMFGTEMAWFQAYGQPEENDAVVALVEEESEEKVTADSAEKVPEEEKPAEEKKKKKKTK